MQTTHESNAEPGPPLKTFIVGYGNPGRQDDGLGPAFVSQLTVSQDLPEGVEVESAYQLEVELAATMAEFDLVVFVDACLDASGPFYFRQIQPDSSGAGFGSHSLTPQALLALAQVVYGYQPLAYVLGIRGTQFGAFEEKLSAEATADLKEALRFFLTWVEGVYTEGKTSITEE